MRRNFKTLLALLAIAYLGIIGWIYLNQRKLLFFPDTAIKQVEEYNLAGTQDLMIETNNGEKIQLWYHPAKHGMPMTLYFHGNSYNLGQRALKFRELIDLGYGFIAPSYSGFGKSDGTPSKESVLESARTAVRFLKDQGFQTKDVLLIGESLGSGVAVNMAIEDNYKGLFLITPYTSIADRAQEIYWFLPVRYLLKDGIESKIFIDKINAPLLMAHGTNDLIIPHTHSKQLFSVAKDPKKLIIYEGKGHSNLDTREIFREMTEYFVTGGYKDASGEFNKD